jgi:hypothetical protein
MFKILIESAIKERLVDIYDKLSIVTSGVASISEKMVAIVDNISENKNKISILMEMHTHLLEALAEQQEHARSSGIPTLADLLYEPPDDDLPN